MKTILCHIAIGLVMALLAGCAAGGRPFGQSASGPAQAYFAEGQAREEAGHVVEATRMYKLALTLAPGSGDIAAALQRVEDRRKQMAQARYQEGERDYAAGKLRESKIAYLAALRLWPAHAGALERLRSREKVTFAQPVRHIVRKGETLGFIARKYYGDDSKYKMLADYNQLADPTRIAIGQLIMIPAQTAVAGGSTPAGGDRRLPAAIEVRISETAQIQVASYRDDGQTMLRAGNYPAAIVSFRKVLQALPEDTKTRVAIGKAYNAYGGQLWDRQEFEPARKQFQACLAYRDGCPACRTVVAACESSYKERLYNRGIALLENGDPAAALGEWEILQTIDPDYRKVQGYIRKARTSADQPQTP
jgi:tetratricopeptide (TPR) repeat protein